jgi:hypothetical protein
LVTGRVAYLGAVSSTKLEGATPESPRSELLCRATAITDVVLEPVGGWTDRPLRPWSRILGDP